MKKVILMLIFCSIILSSLFSEQNSFVIVPNVGLGFGDGDSGFALGGFFGYQFSGSRVSLYLLTASAKRHDYSNGDFKDSLISNFVLKYSKIINTGQLYIVPDIGLGIVTGNWKKHETYASGEEQQSGFGLAFGCGIEYLFKDNLLLRFSYEHALLFGDFSGNGAILGGIGLKF